MSDALYEELLARMSAAHRAGYFLESSWLAYSILEDRLLSVLSDSGGTKYKNHKPIRMLGKKLEEISKRSANDDVLATCFPDAVVVRINSWKDQRNALVHTVEQAEASLKTMIKAAKRLSIDSKPLVRDVSNAAKSLRANKAQSAANE